MALSQAAIMSTSLFFVLWPQLSGGLLSDFKICGDSQCESQMSRVQAVRDHHGKDCRFLSFRKGETIFVYHKLTGKRSHLWAGSMNKQFGYFPKEAVKEKQTYATKEVVVVTQESDFLCINEFGYLIDSSHLNTNDDDDDDHNDDDDDDDSGLKNPEELETRNHPDDTNAGMSKDSTPESFSTSREEIENRDNGAAKTKQESPETAVELKEKGGSPTSSWLSSSVTGWFGVGKKEEPENSAEVHEKRLMPGEDLLPSSVAGWLGLRSEGKSDSAKNDENRGKQDRKTVESSTMTGWLGFGGDEKPDSSADKENDDESEPDVTTAAGENFRSRKLHLEIETLAEQEKKINDMGTLGWLANGLSTTLGFGLDDQDTKETIQVSTEEVDVKETASSWFDLGISNILAFRKNYNEGDRTESHTQSDNILQGHVDSNIQDTPANNKDSEADDTSQVDQNANPPQNQRTDINLVPNADKTQEDPEVTLEDIEHDLIGLSSHQTDQFDEKSDIAIESGGEFDHLKKAIIPSSQKPIMKTKELTESPSGFDGKTNEMSNPQTLPSPKHVLDSTTNSDKDLQTNFQPPSPSPTQTSPSTYLPPNTAKPQQPNPLSKTYKTLQDHMSTQETSILTDLFGKKNLKKLDDILGHADVFTEDVDRDESVLMDIEAILHDHREILFPPSMRLSDAPEEDKEKTGARIAIQKLEILLKRARDIFDTRKSDITRANAQAQPSCIGASCSTSSKDKETTETVGVMVHEQNDGGPEKNQEDDNERGSEEMSLEENVKKMSHSQTTPPQLLEGVTVKNQDSIHRIQKQSSSQTHGMDFVKWLKMKVRVIRGFGQFRTLCSILPHCRRSSRFS
uniref:SH3 domain-containing protein n=1 Tax=Hippocampus comes TaxID=109280 RepID=A0A3Q3DER1_HIPCM